MLLRKACQNCLEAIHPACWDAANGDLGGRFACYCLGKGNPRIREGAESTPGELALSHSALLTNPRTAGW